MKPPYRIILFILICWFGYSAFRQTLGVQQSGLFNVLQHFNLIILIIFSIVAIASDIDAYRSYSKLFQFYSSIAGLFLCIIVLFRLFTFNNIEKSKTLFEVLPKDRTRNTFSIQFKEKDWLVMRDLRSQVPHIYYGRYYINKDTVTITQTNNDEFSKTLPVSGIINEELLILKNADTFLIEKHTE